MANESVAMANQVIGRIVDFPIKGDTRMYDCPQCPGYRRRIKQLEDAIKEHRQAHGAARSFVDEADANAKLWGALGYDIP